MPIPTVDDLLDQAGRLLDHSCSEQICGQCLFRGADGRYYAGSVEFCLSETDPEYVQELLNEQLMEGQDELREIAETIHEASPPQSQIEDDISLCGYIARELGRELTLEPAAIVGCRLSDLETKREQEEEEAEHDQ